MPTGDLVDLEDFLSHTIDAVKQAKIKRDSSSPSKEAVNGRKLQDILGLKQITEKENGPEEVLGDFSDNLLKFTR